MSLRVAGNFGFDPLGLGKDPAKRERYALSELKNGRAAMVGDPLLCLLPWFLCGALSRRLCWPSGWSFGGGLRGLDCQCADTYSWVLAVLDA